MIEIQALRPDDWQIWRALRLEALAEAPHAFGSSLAAWTGEGDLEARWRGRLENVPYNAVARLDGTPAGMIGATAPDAEGRAELLSLWVAPFARGRGVGDALVDAVADYAAGLGAGVLLRVYDDNTPALRLYERRGFAQTAVELSEDGTQREVVMVRPRADRGIR